MEREQPHGVSPKEDLPRSLAMQKLAHNLQNLLESCLSPGWSLGMEQGVPASPASLNLPPDLDRVTRQLPPS